MQAIQTKILPATNTNPTRIKAWCARGSLTLSAGAMPGDMMLSDERAHAHVARLLSDRFVDEDEKTGSKRESNPWARSFITGCLPNGDFAHVTAPREYLQAIAELRKAYGHAKDGTQGDYVVMSQALVAIDREGAFS